MKRGDVVVIARAEEPYFRVGDLARLDRQDVDGHWWADFNGLDNPSVHRDGDWCITQHGACELIEVSEGE